MTTPTTVEPPESRRLLDRLVGQPLPLDSIICGDNCDVLGMFPRDCIDLVVTSPPYDDLRTYGGHSWDFYGVAWQLKRVLKPGGVIVWVVGDATKDGSETGTSMRQALHFQIDRSPTSRHDDLCDEQTADERSTVSTVLGVFVCVVKGQPFCVQPTDRALPFCRYSDSRTIPTRRRRTKRPTWSWSNWRNQAA